MTRAQQLLDAKERLADAKEMLLNYEETHTTNDDIDRYEVLLDLECDVWFAAKHLDKIERSQS